MPPLRVLDLDLESVTPVLSGDAGYRAEIRPPSFRGVSRYWLRTLLGGILGEDLAAIRAVEGMLLGSPRRRSLIAVRAPDQPATGDLPVERNDFPGVGYLFYSAYQNRRDGVLPQEQFRLRVQTHPTVLPEQEIGGQRFDADFGWRLALASFWLVVHLGGVGHRLRRGAGNLRFVVEPSGWPQGLPPPLFQATTPSALADELAMSLTQLRRSFGWEPVAVPAVPSFNLLHPDVCDIYVLDRTYPTWYEALDELGQTFRDFRSRQPDDYANVKGILTRTRRTITGLKRTIFGLPLAFFFSSLYRELIEQGVPSREARARSSAMAVPSRGLGRASPLWFRVVRLSGTSPTYAVQMVLFRSRFLPNDTMRLRPRDRSLAPVEVHAPTDYAYVAEWFDHVAETLAPLVPVAFE